MNKVTYLFILQVFCGKIPRDIFEDELIPLFEKCGTIWDLRLMMDPMTGLNRGYCFVTFSERDGALEGVKQVSVTSIHFNVGLYLLTSLLTLDICSYECKNIVKVKTDQQQSSFGN